MITGAADKGRVEFSISLVWAVFQKEGFSFDLRWELVPSQSSRARMSGRLEKIIAIDFFILC